jgi:hypothetical protein
MKNHEKQITRELRWESDNVFTIDDVTFVVETGENLYAATSREQTFVIGKSRRQLETLRRLSFEKPVKRIFDLGIYKGGSVMFYHKLFSPEKIVAIDLNREPVEPLEAYIRRNGLGEVIRTRYGVDQSDAETIRGILRAEMAGQLFDMVVDDASHFLKETRASFNLLFPHVIPGGYYIIEDWGWAHWQNQYWQENGGPWPQDPPLTNLIFEATMLLASRPDWIESVFLLPAYAVIKRGPKAMDRESGIFDLSRSYLNRGKEVRLLA